MYEESAIYTFIFGGFVKHSSQENAIQYIQKYKSQKYIGLQELANGV